MKMGERSVAEKNPTFTNPKFFRVHFLFPTQFFFLLYLKSQKYKKYYNENSPAIIWVPLN